MNFPTSSTARVCEWLQPTTDRIRMVLDTDTHDEIDASSQLSMHYFPPIDLMLRAIYAPFHDRRSSGPADGMEKSYQEILRILNTMNVSPNGLVFRGSTDYLKDTN